MEFLDVKFNHFYKDLELDILKTGMIPIPKNNSQLGWELVESFPFLV